MPRLLRCPVCNHEKEIPDTAVSGRFRCPKCGTRGQLPGPDQTPAPILDHPVEEIPEAILAEPETEDLPEAVPIADDASAALPPDRLAACRLLRPRSFRLNAQPGSGNSLDYSIFDDDNRRLGDVQDSSDSGGGLTDLFVQKGQQACTSVLYDAATDKPVIVVHREAFRKIVGVKPARVDICDHKDRLLGWFEIKPFPAKGTFPIFDGRDRHFAEVDGKWYPEPAYVFWDETDQKIGKVSAEGEPRRFFTSQLSWCKRGGDLLLTVAKDLADDACAKALLLSTMVALEQFGGSLQLPHTRF